MVVITAWKLPKTTIAQGDCHLFEIRDIEDLLDAVDKHIMLTVLDKTQPPNCNICHFLTIPLHCQKVKITWTMDEGKTFKSQSFKGDNSIHIFREWKKHIRRQNYQSRYVYVTIWEPKKTLYS